MVIFHSYVSLPEGNCSRMIPDGPTRSVRVKTATFAERCLVGKAVHRAEAHGGVRALDWVQVGSTQNATTTLGIPPLISSFTKKNSNSLSYIYVGLSPGGSLDIASYDFRLPVYPLGDTPFPNWRLFGREKPEEKRDLEVSYCTIPSSWNNMVYINH